MLRRATTTKAPKGRDEQAGTSTPPRSGKRRRADEYRDHVASLCRAHGIELDERRSRGGRAVRYRHSTRRVISVAQIRGPVSYWVALHELGHHLARGRTAGGRIDKELVAWEWALDAAHFAPSLSVRRAIVRSLRSYIEWALARQYRRHSRPRLPGTEHPIWDFMADLALPEDRPLIDRLWREVALAGG